MTLKTNFFYLLRIVVLPVFLFAGCGLRTGERSVSANTEGFSIGCLNGINKKAELYMSGKLNAHQINQTANCINTALRIFKNRVRGQKQGEFAPDELRKFIQDLFLQDRAISDGLLLQLVRLKQVIIGGTANRLTESDIERFIVFVNVLKKEAVFFQPYIKTLNSQERQPTKQSEKWAGAVSQKFKESISRISGFLKEFSMPYLISDITALVQELNLFFEKQPKNMPYLEEKMKLTGALKQFIVGGSDSVVKPEEWEDFLLGYSF